MTVSEEHNRSHWPIATVLVALCLFRTAAQAQPVSFTLKTNQDCPIALVSYTPTVIRIAGSRRQFVTVKNVSDRPVVGLLFQQTIADGSRQKIVALERVSVIFKLHETKRLSVSVDDVWNLIQNAAKSGVPIDKPVLSIVVVEFIDGSTWNAPADTAGR